MNYYAGDNVPLKFTILEGTTPVTPTAAKITIYKPSKTKVAEVGAGISSNEVSYSVPTTVTNETGVYTVYFILTLTSKRRTHKMEFRIERDP